MWIDMRIRLIFLILLSLNAVLSGCAVLHKVQLSDLNRPKGKVRKKVSIKASETTVSLRELGDLTRAAGQTFKSRGAENTGKLLQAYTTFFQMGPTTGTPVFNELYARDIPQRLASECKNGTLTDIISVRESREYPVVKGEVVRIDAVCVTNRAR